MKSNKLSLDMTELREYFSNMQPGDEVELIVLGTVDEIPGQFVTVSVKSAEVDGGVPEAPEEGDAAGGYPLGSEYEPMTFPPEPLYA